MPYLNKRNRFVAAAKQYAEANSLDIAAFNKFNLLDIAQSINMKGIPTWVLKDCKTDSKGVYNLTSLIAPVTV
jgi:hypothetical protein